MLWIMLASLGCFRDECAGTRMLMTSALGHARSSTTHLLPCPQPPPAPSPPNMHTAHVDIPFYHVHKI